MGTEPESQAKLGNGERGRPKPRWNGEPCQAEVGTAIVGKSPRPTWWCAGMEGRRRKCVRVCYQGETFYLDDEDWSGSFKIFVAGGDPFTGHKSLPVDDETSFLPATG